MGDINYNRATEMTWQVVAEKATSLYSA